MRDGGKAFVDFCLLGLWWFPGTGQTSPARGRNQLDLFFILIYLYGYPLLNLAHLTSPLVSLHHISPSSSSQFISVQGSSFNLSSQQLVASSRRIANASPESPQLQPPSQLRQSSNTKASPRPSRLPLLGSKQRFVSSRLKRTSAPSSHLFNCFFIPTIALSSPLQQLHFPFPAFCGTSIVKMDTRSMSSRLRELLKVRPASPTSPPNWP